MRKEKAKKFKTKKLTRKEGIKMYYEYVKKYKESLSKPKPEPKEISLKEKKLYNYKYYKTEYKKKIRNNTLKNDFYTKKNVEDDEYITEILQITRTTKVIEGGKRITFKILSITGNEKNTLGIGIGKAENFMSALKKSIKNSCKNLKVFDCKDRNSIKKISIGKLNNTEILLKPKKKVGNKVNNIVHIFCKLLGIKNLTSKHKGPKNILNTTFATFYAFKNI